ncbi:hypothetical protein [Halegenticoccus soli]|uniref:hypothetical protein n=1 Tax=Halegenticoccus soli TaxID=1985678 RepID=UPI000C6C90FD|nr:hypothetical protein [Halegenticoccus soli]
MATIVFESPDGVVEREVEDGELRYNDAREVWSFPIGETDDGDAITRNVPRERVYYTDAVRDRTSPASDAL